MSHPLLSRLGRGHGAVTASAGTGKTHFLEQLVLDEVMRGQALDRILLVTYTKKGALELKARIRAALSNEGLDPKRRIQARRELERATLATIHSFCQQILAEEAFLAGRAFKPELAPGGPLRARAFREALRKGLVGSEAEIWARELEERGPEALEKTITKLMSSFGVMAPTSSDLEALVEPFRRKALYEALDQAFAAITHASTRKTYQEFQAQVLADRALTSDPESFLRALQSWKEPAGKWGEALPPAFREAYKRLSAFNPIALRLRPLIQASVHEMEALKAAEGVVDFDDLIHQLKAALEGLQGEALAERIGSRFDLCLLDEAQDTNEDQWAILWRLFRDKRLVMVGDAKQAIFSFQGGDLPTFLSARKELLDHGGAEASLKANWRSTAAMVEACNGLLGLGTETPLLIEPSDPVKAFTPEDLTPAEACPAPAEWVDPMPAVVALPVPFARTLDEAAPASARILAEALRDLRRAAPRFRRRGDSHARPITYSDIFVLVRKGADADLAAAAFREAGVPFVQHKARGLFEGDTAADLLALFLALDDPKDASARMRAFLTPFFGLAFNDAMGARDLEETHPLMLQLLEWSRLAREGRAAALFDRVLGGGAVARLLAEPDGQRRVADLLHLTELLQEAAGVGDGPADHARRLAQWKDDHDRPSGEEESIRRLEQEGDAVRILTYHAAKGLQAPVVALFGGLSEGGGGDLPIQPFHRRDGQVWERQVWVGKADSAPGGMSPQAESRAEDRRLLYVGLTRAEGLLLLPFHDAPAADEKPPSAKSSFDMDGRPKGPYGHLQRALEAWKDRAPWLHWGMPALPPPSPAHAPSPLVLPPPFPFEAVKAKAWPAPQESFTSLHRRLEAAAGAQDPEPDRLPRTEGLPGGTATGVALHGLLETAGAHEFDPSFRAWWTDARRAWAERGCAAAGLDPRWAEEAGKLVHAGLGTPLNLPGPTPISFAKLDPSRVARELDFLADTAGGRLTGALDALFEHEGRVYLLDWKSNLLPDYGPEQVASCVEEDYRLQVKVYTIAALRFLRIADEAAYEARFGGAIYVFLRGLPSGGQWAERPTWQETRAWQEELKHLLERAHA